MFLISFNYLGQLYYSQKEYQKAIEQYQFILTMEPKNAEIMSILGSLYLEINDRPKAIEYFQMSIDIDPEHDGSLNSLGYIYAEEGINLDQAVNMVKKALELKPDNGGYMDSLGWVYYKKGMYGEALDYLNKAIHLFEDPVIYDHLGDVYHKLNEKDNAIKSWRRSLELLPGQESVSNKIETIQANP